MKKTKLAPVGVIVAVLISAQSLTIYTQSKSIHELKEGIKMTTEQHEWEIKALKEELTKSKDKAKQEEDQNNELQQQINTLTKQIKELSMREPTYNPNDITVKSNISKAKLASLLSSTGLKGLEDAFKEAENTYGINALFLVGLVANESSWGTSYRARNHNNLTGYAVYTSASRGGYFPSKGESILATARLLSEDYVNPKGEHYNGVSIWNINIKYCQKNNRPNMEWSSTINSIVNDLLKH